MAPPIPPVPEWRSILETQLKDNPQCNVYALATTEGSEPRVRHVVHRAFTPSNLLLATTDRRMPKAAQVAAAPAVELAWFFAPIWRQVRVRGRAYTYHPDETASALIASRLPPSPGGTLDATSVQAHGTAAESAESQGGGSSTGGAAARDAAWKAQWEHLFHTAMSPYLRATFARPAVPGSRLVDAPDPATWPNKLDMSWESKGAPENAAHLALAAENFVLLVIEPERVEVLDLMASPHARTEWVNEDGVWVKDELVP